MQSGVRTEISDIPVDRRVRATAIRAWVYQKDRHREGSARPTTKNPTVHRIRTDPTRVRMGGGRQDGKGADRSETHHRERDRVSVLASWWRPDRFGCFGY